MPTETSCLVGVEVVFVPIFHRFDILLFALILPHLSAARPTLWLRCCSCSQPSRLLLQILLPQTDVTRTMAHSNADTPCSQFQLIICPLSCAWIYSFIEPTNCFSVSNPEYLSTRHQAYQQPPQLPSIELYLPIAASIVPTHMQNNGPKCR